MNSFYSTSSTPPSSYQGPKKWPVQTGLSSTAFNGKGKSFDQRLALIHEIEDFCSYFRRHFLLIRLEPAVIIYSSIHISALKNNNVLKVNQLFLE